MILQTLRLVGFRGLAETRVGGVAERGVSRVDLPAGADATTLASALRFLLLGAAPETPDAPGLAFVEGTFRTDSGRQVSVFRGVDARGSTQVSLREPVGPAVTDGHEAVAARLEELIGESPAAWCRAAVDVPLPAVEPVPVSQVPDAPGRADLAPMADAARNAAHELRRALRSERLRLLASRRHGELQEHGRRLRHERGVTALAVDRECTERDRLRARVRGVNEYRDQLERGAEDRGGGSGAEPDTTIRGGAAGMSLAEIVLVGCAALLFTALVLYSTATSADPDRRLLQIGLGVGFLISVASYLHVASRPSTPRAPSEMASTPADDARARRDALRHRFADLGDPDDPELTSRLRARLADVDARLAPLQARLESLDDAISLCDVELGRAARSLHETRPELVPGDAGLPEEMDLAAAVARVHELGDSVYAAVVERDALLSAGTAEPGEARQALAVALDALADASEAPADVPMLLRRVDAFACSVTEEAEEDHIAGVLEDAIRRMEHAEPVAVASDDGPDGSPVLRGLVVPRGDAAECSDEDLVRRFGPDAQILVAGARRVDDVPVRLREPGLPHGAE